MLSLYSLALLVILVLTAPIWFFRIARGWKYRSVFFERFGVVPVSLRAQSAQPTLWLHGASAGEILAAKPLLKQLQEVLPQHRIVVSTSTASGRVTAVSMVGEGKVFSLPFDLGFLMERYLKTLRPELVMLMENDVWPNLIERCRRQNIPVVVVNAHIADDSSRRLRISRPLWRQAFQDVALFLAQSERDANRILEIGANPETVMIAGNLKFDAEVPATSQFVATLAGNLPKSAALVVCGSTGEGEEAMLLNAWEKISERFPEAMLVLAPRKADRFDAVARLIVAQGCSVVRLSRWRLDPLPIARDSVVLLDTIGELASLYQLARIAFVGGSLVTVDGHNPLEPARFGVPVLMGEHVENVREIVAALQDAGGIRVVSAEELSEAVAEWLAEPDRAVVVGVRGRGVCAAQSGATERTLRALLPLVVSRD